jgi:SHS2 domain-containing protein
VTYRWVDHTAEVELEIEADSERGVLEDALRALAELLGIGDPGSGDPDDAPDVRVIAVEAGDRPALLAAWIEELAFLAESEGFVATRLVKLDLDANHVRATVAGVFDEPPPLVKAVTYHRLSFERHGEGYGARVVLDV